MGPEPSHEILPAHQALADALLGRWNARGHADEWARLKGFMDGRAPSPGGPMEPLAGLSRLVDAATRVSLPRWLEASGLEEAAERLRACPAAGEPPSREGATEALASTEREIDRLERGLSQELEQEVRARLTKGPAAIRGMAIRSIPVAVMRAAGEAARKGLSVLEAVDAIAQSRRHATEVRLDCDEAHTDGAQALAEQTGMVVGCGRRLAAALGARVSLRGLDELLRAATAGAETIFESTPERDWAGAFAVWAENATRAHLGRRMDAAIEAVEARNRAELVDWVAALRSCDERTS